MIDRLEELLEQVEEPEESGKTVLLRQVWAASGRSAEVPLSKGTEQAAARQGRRGRQPDAGGAADAPETAFRSDTGKRAEAPLLQEVTYTETGSALPGLYRQIARAAGGESAERSASVAVVREAASETASGLTAGELDLAVRRDSRRYDGGMTIY